LGGGVGSRGSAVVRALASHQCDPDSILILGIFSVLCGKCSKDAEDADVRELCGSVPPHPVRCPVKALISDHTHK